VSRRPATSLSSGPYLDRLQGHREVREQLLRELLALPVPAFDRLAARLLLECGYQTVQVLAEARGGADLLASASGGLCPARTLVQAKQYRAPVSRRFVDELRGAMLRHQAQQGLLVTTSTFFGPAYRAADLECALPVRLVDGEELLDLLLAKRLGVRASQGGRLALDREFFAALVQERRVKPGRASHPQSVSGARRGGAACRSAACNGASCGGCR